MQPLNSIATETTKTTKTTKTASADNNWLTKLVGNTLLDCNANAPVETGSALDPQRTPHILALYFSFANVTDHLVPKLKELYRTLNNHGNGGTNNLAAAAAERQNTSSRPKPEKQLLQVIQVVLWANNDVYGDFEGSHKECLLDVPWFAVPYREINLKTRLARRYRIKSGVPTLVLLDSSDGSTVSASAQDRLLEDPAGLSFPWRPRPVDQVLEEVALQRCSAHSAASSDDDVTVRYADLKAIRGFYFSANWCPPCRAFTPQLAQVYAQIRQNKEPHFEIVFVSSDRSAESFATYVESMPWLAIPYQQSAVRAELAQLYGIRGIPTLVLLDTNGHLITTDGRQELAEDPLAVAFPWRPKVVNVLTERFAAKLYDYSAIVLFVESDETDVQYAQKLLEPAAKYYYNKHQIDNHEHQLSGPHSRDRFVDDDLYVQFLVAFDSEAAEVLRDLLRLEVAEQLPDEEEGQLLLLAAVDLPCNRFAIMDRSKMPLTVETAIDFVQRFENGSLPFVDLVAETQLVPQKQ